mmetsp:Transcript_86706/g.280185  ORF Transcript_86706/g.280185 Transcript_86706/m.280185 type:complete len:338 (+) Transcript_86706:133-1146(+)
MADGGLPAVGALGSYKGVMLCNRPPDAGGAAGGGSMMAGAGQAPFKSTISATVGEKLGLPPPRREEGDGKSEMVIKMRGPSAALRRHCQWIKELQEQVKDDHRQTEEDSVAHDERRQKMATVFKKQRDAIQRIKKDSSHTGLEPADVEAILRPGGKPKATTRGQKPLWALTELQKEGVEDEDAALLIQFAQDLDFDKYIDDMEFRQCLQVVQHRARKLQREQDAFKDALVAQFNTPPEDDDEHLDSVSELGSKSSARARRFGGGVGGAGGGEGSRPDWDTSTSCGDEMASADRQAHHDLAAQAMENNPQLRALHSKGSLQKLVEKAQSSGPPSSCGP